MLPAAIVLAKYLPGATAAKAKTVRASGERVSFKGFLQGRWALAPWVLVGFLLLVICRSWVAVGLNTYVPKLYAGFGYSPAEYGSVLSAILFADAAGGFLGGFIADRVGRRRVITLSLTSAAPALLFFFLLPRPWNLVFGVLGGFCLNISQSVTLLIGQGLLPGRVGLASGLIMGFTFVAGALAASASGAAADRIGLLVTLRFVALLPFIGAACSLLLPRDKPS
jgi:FSR family fosmidomycin resistance protein-like MFS transporter